MKHMLSFSWKIFISLITEPTLGNFLAEEPKWDNVGIVKQLTAIGNLLKDSNAKIFTVLATCSGLVVAFKFINSRDKRAAVNYAVWWTVGLIFFSSLSSIMSTLNITSTG